MLRILHSSAPSLIATHVPEASPLEECTRATALAEFRIVLPAKCRGPPFGSSGHRGRKLGADHSVRSRLAAPVSVEIRAISSKEIR